MNRTFLRNTLPRESIRKLQPIKKENNTIAVPHQLKIKRVCEVILALFTMTLIGFWLFPLIALFIKLSSKGPVLFRQLRHGKDNVPFYCYKFRTMVLNDEADTVQAKKGDKRITKIGRILRKSSLDELPQLINVLKGDMAFVGPRPHAVPMNEIFSRVIPGYMHRHVMKPGITGLAQSRGSRGEFLNYYDLNFRYRLDMFYIKKWNLILDLKIIFWTIQTVFFNNEKAI
ncbi:MAG: sugar transferase [Anditalea sp.]